MSGFKRYVSGIRLKQYEDVCVYLSCRAHARVVRGTYRSAPGCVCPRRGVSQPKPGFYVINTLLLSGTSPAKHASSHEKRPSRKQNHDVHYNHDKNINFYVPEKKHNCCHSQLYDTSSLYYYK